MERLTRAFFARPAPVVARDLVGKLLVRADEGMVVRIVETEAYTQDDPACHAYGGVPTVRTTPLFGPPGHAYVYFSYGMHWCLNTVTGQEGVGQGCLLRAAEPIAGLEAMRARRGDRPERELLRGPARLAQALGIDGGWTGSDLCDPDGRLVVADDGTHPDVEVGPRVGVSRAADLPWRFFVPGSRWVSAYKRSPRAPRPGTAG